MKRIVYTFLALTVVAFTSCNTVEEVKKEDTNKVEKPTLERLQAVSDSMAKILQNDMPKIVVKNYNNAIARNIDIYSNYPESENAPKALDLVQGYATQLENHSLSAQMSEKLIEQYPEYKNNERIIFELANDYNLFLKDTVKAKKYFHLLLEKYPETKFKSDTEFVLKNLGKTPEELIMQAQEGLQ